ncbi:MAG: AzlD domain-containing protein [Sphaerochaetaceae bacterium]|jgi:branched-subunit amino acid transport protein|nr:AzlD domain-containing protein [Sphaerochaetaceae bacterium]
MKHNVYVYIIIMALVTYLIRMLPLAVLRKELKSRFLRSFLYYVPFVSLSVMTFPQILYATGSPALGALAMALSIGLSLAGVGLDIVALCSCLAVYLASLL